MFAHVGCGSVYLNGWMNVDLPLPSVYLATERPDLVDRFSAEYESYYSRHEDKTHDLLRSGPVTRETVCDVYGSFELLPFRPASLFRLLSVQVFEHLDRAQAECALKECHRVLTRDGLLTIDVPDPDETLRMYHQTGDEFYIRHLFGPRRSAFGFHTHYNRETLRSIVECHGFTLFEERPNIHHYPAFCLEFRKS